MENCPNVSITCKIDDDRNWKISRGNQVFFVTWCYSLKSLTRIPTEVVKVPFFFSHPVLGKYFVIMNYVLSRHIIGIFTSGSYHVFPPLSSIWGMKTCALPQLQPVEWKKLEFWNLERAHGSWPLRPFCKQTADSWVRLNWVLQISRPKAVLLLIVSLFTFLFLAFSLFDPCDVNKQLTATLAGHFLA